MVYFSTYKTGRNSAQNTAPALTTQPTKEAVMADQKVLNFDDEEKEVWEDIEGYEGLYEISNKGRIRGYQNFGWGVREEPKILNPCLNHNGYLQIGLVKDKKRKNVRINRLVAKHFIPNPKDKPQVNHKDADKTNNAVENLEWVTAQENASHAKENDLIKKGEANGFSKLTENDVLDIRNTYKLGCFSQKEIAEAFDISQLHVSRIVRRKRWKHI